MALCLEGRWMAAVLAAGPGAVLSHRDAAALWELLRPPRRALIDVMTPRRSRKRIDGVDLHRTRSLSASSVTRRRLIPVTTVARTLLDLADVVPPHHLRRAVDEARRTGCSAAGSSTAFCAPKAPVATAPVGSRSSSTATGAPLSPARSSRSASSPSWSSANCHGRWST